MAASTPPSCTARCALDRRRSAPARCSAAPVSGNSQKAWMEMRGTGRSCGAAPKLSTWGGLATAIILLLVHVRHGTGLVLGLLRCGGFALLVTVDDGGGALAVGGIETARAHQIARVGDHGGDIVLDRAAEIRRGLVFLHKSQVLGPVAAGIGVGGIADVADIDPEIAIGDVMGRNQNLVAADAGGCRAFGEK